MIVFFCLPYQRRCANESADNLLLVLILIYKFMYQVEEKTLDLIQKIYNQFCVSSNCFALSNPSRLKKMTFLVSGCDKTSLQLVQELRALHAFYSTYQLNLDLCSKERNLDLFLEEIKHAHPMGNGLLIADEAYYSWLMDDNKELQASVGLIRPDFNDDYIQKMVTQEMPESYVQHIQGMKDAKKTSLGGTYRKQIKKYDFIAVRNDSIESWVYAAYIYHEIKLLYGIKPRFIITSDSMEALSTDKCSELLCKLNVAPVIQPSYVKIEELMGQKDILFVVPKRFSTITFARINCLKEHCKLSGNFGIYVFDEDLQEILADKANNVDDILYDINNILPFIPFQSEFDEYWSVIQKERDKFYASYGENSYQQQAYLRKQYKEKKVEVLIEKHQSYLSKLFQL